jgi:hypothetical protein
MIRAIGAVVHESMKPHEAFEAFVRLAAEPATDSMEVA